MRDAASIARIRKPAFCAQEHMGAIAISGPLIWLTTIKKQFLPTMSQRVQTMRNKVCLPWVKKDSTSLRRARRQLLSNHHHPRIATSPAPPHKGGGWGELLRRKRRRMQELKQTKWLGRRVGECNRPHLLTKQTSLLAPPCPRV